ncbi:MAG: hypothetical protein DI570_09210 [Phenylobacterium zucineum]|nr:MAG: hypothetical protein DI570_09210 [Phenylobacterium zucineum]
MFCNTCPWGQTGMCRRYPPAAGMGFAAAWPLVGKADWCAEHPERMHDVAITGGAQFPEAVLAQRGSSDEVAWDFITLPELANEQDTPSEADGGRAKRPAPTKRRAA